MDPATLDIAHSEILRLKERQSARIASVRARTTGILGASGIAASLVSALSDNPWYGAAIACFVFATVNCVRAMTLRIIPVKHPVGVLSSVTRLDPFAARVEIIKQIRLEYDREEDGLREMAGSTAQALSWFMAGTFVLLMVTVLPALATAFQGG
ncbi:hypothetical protein OYT00_14095 [Microbacterium paraoxydans]|uniref:hypothetical protein n=1 Tax=Microbacterium paraoxydans TaxID=199592 RepID=UPI002286598C|nr:hypothetical protein [Microbacterium paraoxydans]MCZ0711139.1 hypothetical protein [Microbacterium paraoxydans]